MNPILTDEVVLKQDVLGRVKAPKARREQLLDELLVRDISMRRWDSVLMELRRRGRRKTGAICMRSDIELRFESTIGVMPCRRPVR